MEILDELCIKEIHVKHSDNQKTVISFTIEIDE